MRDGCMSMLDAESNEAAERAIKVGSVGGNWSSRICSPCHRCEPKPVGHAQAHLCFGVPERYSER